MTTSLQKLCSFQLLTLVTSACAPRVAPHCPADASPASPSRAGLPAPSKEAPPASASRQGIVVKNTCSRVKDGILVHVLIPVHYRFRGEGLPKESDDAAIHHLICPATTGACTGLVIEWSRIHTTHLFGVMDAHHVEGAKITSDTPSVVVISFGPWRTVTVDFAQGKIAYAESSPTTEGRGEVKCETAPAW